MNIYYQKFTCWLVIFRLDKTFKGWFKNRNKHIYSLVLKLVEVSTANFHFHDNCTGASLSHTQISLFAHF